MKNIHSPHLVGIGSWGPEIWLHEYLISSIEISVNWPGSKQLNCHVSNRCAKQCAKQCVKQILQETGQESMKGM